MNEPERQLMSILGEAVEYRSPEERAAFLERACACDAGLRARVNALLRAYEAAGSFLEGTAPAREPVATVDELIGERPGTVIGPYKLLEPIGEGGFGVVFMAEQQQPLRRKVALKVLKPGMDSAQVIARFEAERQALALMDHPHIATVHDAGATASGRPYFVMELVKGLPITDFCDQSQFTPTERLELFVAVCQAVQHAHQKGVIHRDLKPSNVLVTLQDGAALVKVIDFGIAKALGQQLTDKTVFTGFAQMIGTPLYMSPEQAALSNVDVDTRSDVYSLGVLLYELLTGTTPFTKERLQEAGYDEMRRIIREEEPPRPSTRISTQGPEATAVSTQRKSDPKRLSRLLRGELDWMVMKALEKNRNRRYETASAFAADVLRYLNDEAVLACPPSAWYRLRKLVRRHRGPVLAAGVVVALLVGGIIGTTLGLVRAVTAEGDATAQRLRAEGERDAKEEALARAEANAKRAVAAQRRTREVLDAMLQDLIEQHLLGKQVRPGRYEKAFLRKVQRFYEELSQAEGDTLRAGLDRAVGLHHLGTVRFCLGELKEAEAAYRASLVLSRHLVADFPRVALPRQGLAGILISLGRLLRETGRTDEPEKLYREALALSRALADEFPTNAAYRYNLAEWHNNLGSLLAETHRPGDAEPVFRQGLALYQRLISDLGGLAKYRHGLARTQHNLGTLHYHMGRFRDAEGAFRAALAIQHKLVAELTDVPEYCQELARSHNNLSGPLKKLGRLAEAEAANREALVLFRQLAADFPAVPAYRLDLANCQVIRGGLLANSSRPKEAEAAYGEALAIVQKLAADYPTVADYANSVAGTLANLSYLHTDAKDYVEARKLLEQARPYHRRALAASPTNGVYREFFRNNRETMCEVLAGLGEHDAAAREAEELARLSYQPPRDLYNAGCILARCATLAAKDSKLTQMKRRELAGRYADQAMDRLRQAGRAGFKDVAQLKKDADLDPLRGREDFRKLVRELEKSQRKDPKDDNGPGQSP
jgi:serine/threonine protein kinase/tetratricopeptide (TPR) repeat protein